MPAWLQWLARHRLLLLVVALALLVVIVIIAPAALVAPLAAAWSRRPASPTGGLGRVASHVSTVAAPSAGRTDARRH